jgi:hypothetical protein
MSPLPLGSSCKAHDPFHLRPQGLHGFEPLGLLVLETGQLVQDHHIKIQPAVFPKPHQIFPVHNVNIHRFLESPPSFRHVPHHDAASEIFQVVPFPNLLRPSVPATRKGATTRTRWISKESYIRSRMAVRVVTVLPNLSPYPGGAPSPCGS